MTVSTVGGFDLSIARELNKFLERPQALGRGRRDIAVFDADGTLWRGDVGEAFYRHQIQRKTIPGAPPRDPWDVYIKEAIEGDTVKAYGWLAQWNAGVAEDDLNRWCEEYFNIHFAHMIFAPMRELAHALINAGFEVWVVTASPRWIVQAGVKGFGIQPDRVIGTSVVVEKGRLTDKVEQVPYRAAKAKLIQSVIGQKPSFAAGNTYWDKEMMVIATELALAIHSENKGEPNFESEQRLQKLARANKWLSQRF
jgi:phosphoserine phosphatase